MFIGAKLCKVSDIGIGEYMYGGRLLEFMAEQGAIYAMKVTTATHMVGYRFDEIIIRKPVKNGDIIDFYGENPQLRTSSITFTLRAEVAGETVCSGQLTYVAINPDGSKQPLRQS